MNAIAASLTARVWACSGPAAPLGARRGGAARSACAISSTRVGAGRGAGDTAAARRARRARSPPARRRESRHDALHPPQAGAPGCASRAAGGSTARGAGSRLSSTAPDTGAQRPAGRRGDARSLPSAPPCRGGGCGPGPRRAGRAARRSAW